MTRRQTILVLAGLALLTFLPGLGAHDLWNPDEPRYAEVAREMTETGEYMVPHLSGLVYAEKPPMFFWLIALSGKLLGGLDEFAVRLPSALAAMGATVLVYLLAALYFESRAALLSAVIYLTCAKVLLQGRTGQIDMTLGFWVILAMYLWARHRRHRLALGKGAFPWGFWIVAGLATVTKGPVGLLPPLLTLLAFLVWERDRYELSRLRVGRGLLLWLGVVLLWLVPAILVGGQSYFDVIVLKQNVTRYANPWGHLKPWYYYLTVLPGDFFPWLFLLPGALLAGRRTFSGAERRGLRLCLTWVIVTLIFFSLSSGKRTVYILQMYPALAILLGAGLDAWERDRRVSNAWFSWPLGVLGVLFAVAAGLLPSRIGEIEEAALLPDLAAILPWIVATLAALLLVSAVLYARRRCSAATWFLGTGMAALFAFGSLWVMPRLDPLKSGRLLGETAAEVAGEDGVIAIFPKVEAGMLFYAERNFQVLCSEVELRDFMTADADHWLLAEIKMLERVQPPLLLEEIVRDVDPKDALGLFRRGTRPWRNPGSSPKASRKPVDYGYPCGS
ncbi:MAG: glycosyltransferase family 39 protein [Thermoanaerobaculia bacterium]|nr:glycosyltransferase family 39 protein [Thermoanaerobaculia bacterium]